MSKIPDKIFIQQYEDPEIEGFQSGEDVTWSADQINDHDVEYVRKDKLEKENAKLKAFLSEARGELHRMMIVLPVEYQSKKFLGICQDIGCYEALKNE